MYRVSRPVSVIDASLLTSSLVYLHPYLAMWSAHVRRQRLMQVFLQAGLLLSIATSLKFYLCWEPLV